MDDYKEIIWFAVSFIIAAVVLGMFAVFNAQVGDMAAIRHDDISAINLTREAKRCYVYDGAVLTGADVIAILRENAVSYGEYIITLQNTDGSVLAEQDHNNYASASWRLSNLRGTIPAADIYEATAADGRVTLRRMP